MFLSIHLNSNRPKNIEELVTNIQNTSKSPSEIEVIMNIDEGDDACRDMIESLKTRTDVKLKYIQTNIIKSFKDVWKPYNQLLQLTDPSVYFVTLFSDEFRFKTAGWDETLKRYIHYYDDDIFRIRLSRYRYRNYSDFWECIFAPDSLAFYTKKWMNTVGEWCPCTGPDSWQQLVAYYLTNARKFDHIQYNRDIADPFIEFDGEGAGCGLSEDASRKRNKDNVDLWFDTVSHKMQEKAKSAAARLQATIIMHESKNNNHVSHNFISNRKPIPFHNKNYDEIDLTDNKQLKRLEFHHKNQVIYSISYRISKWKLFFINNRRKANYAYFAGGGEDSFIKDFSDQIYVYTRIRKYGIFTPEKFVDIEKSKFVLHRDPAWIKSIKRQILIAYTVAIILIQKGFFLFQKNHRAKKDT